jgi:hypothetical protein
MTRRSGQALAEELQHYRKSQRDQGYASESFVSDHKRRKGTTKVKPSGEELIDLTEEEVS